MKQFSCGDVVPGCGRRFSAADEAGRLAQVAEHARSDHALITLPVSVVQQVRECMVSV